MYDTVDIVYGKNGKRKLTVRGLCSEDITTLVRKHKDQMAQIFDLLEKGFDIQDESMKEFGWELLERFPKLVAQVVALAADKSNQVEGVSKLPTPVQIKALKEIYDLTITDTGGLNDFLELVTSMVTNIRVEMQNIQAD